MYYFIFYWMRSRSSTATLYPCNHVLKDIHPLQYEKSLNETKDDLHYITLESWREITEEEYKTYLEYFLNK